MKRLLVVMSIAASILALTAGIIHADRTYQEGFAYTATGGGLNSDDGQLQLYIPPGAYIGDLRIRYTPKTLAHFPGEPWTYSSFILIGKPFQLDIEIKEGGESIELEKPGTMVVPYNPAEFGGRSESTLRLAGFDGDRTQWNPITSTVDPLRRVVVAEVTEGGDFGLIIDNGPPAATPAPEAVPTPGPGPVLAEVMPMHSGITGRVFYDRDGNGAMDGEDFPIAGAGLKISSGAWSALTNSGPDGNYAFWSLRDSAYTVELVVGPEWAFTTPKAVGDLKVDGLGEQRTANFGMWYKME